MLQQLIDRILATEPVVPKKQDLPEGAKALGVMHSDLVRVWSFGQRACDDLEAAQKEIIPLCLLESVGGLSEEDSVRHKELHAKVRSLKREMGLAASLTKILFRLQYGAEADLDNMVVGEGFELFDAPPPSKEKKEPEADPIDELVASLAGGILGGSVTVMRIGGIPKE